MEILPFFEYSLYQMFHMFIFWSFIGWCIEVVDMTIETGEYQNRGFLNMPICPIYGFGVLMVVTFFRPIENTFLPLFFATAVLCTTFELLVGLGMEKLFGARWWDYSMKKFNFRGYICLGVSIGWGLGCVLVIRVVHPMVEMIVDKIPVKMGLGLIVLWSVLIIIDMISSICAVTKLNNRLKQIDEISGIMLLGAVKLGGKLADKTIETKEMYDKFWESADSKTREWKEKYGKYLTRKGEKARIEEIEREYGKIVESENFRLEEYKEKYERLVDFRDKSVERLLRAFPQLRSVNYSEAMDAMKQRLTEISAKRREKKAERQSMEEARQAEEEEM